MTFTPDQLPSILAGHMKWLRGETGGTRAHLRGAHLSGAHLSGANLSGANLSGADLSGADLSGAHLSGANLSGANLSGADLSGANLRSAHLSGADLSGADLSGADLSGAHLRSAHLSGAYLSGADLRSANGSDLAVARTRILPEGDLIGYKSCRDGVIVRLRIPEAAKRSHAFGRKCRAEYATVLGITGPNGSKRDTATSKHDFSFTYTVGATVRPEKPFSENWTEECESGIHFFITRAEAENY